MSVLNTLESVRMVERVRICVVITDVTVLREIKARIVTETLMSVRNISLVRTEGAVQIQKVPSSVLAIQIILGLSATKMLMSVIKIPAGVITESVRTFMVGFFVPATLDSPESSVIQPVKSDGTLIWYLSWIHRAFSTQPHTWPAGTFSFSYSRQ